MAANQTLDEAVAEIKNDAEAFKAFWLKEREKNPQHFPLEMGPGDWFDQFMSFVTSNP